MVINVQEKRIEFNLKELLEEEDVVGKLHTLRENNLFLSDRQIEILKKYNIDYRKYTLTHLLFEIDEILSLEEDTELAGILEELSEYHYYKEVLK